MEESQTIKLWMPLTKAKDGRTVGILSDTSMDRDNESMSKELIQNWSENTKSLKMLANHNNKMENWIGGWKNIKILKKGSRTALTAEPWFFSKEANPLAYQIKIQIEEALDNNENPGISIGALVKGIKEIEDKENPGRTTRVWTDAELVEASFVPVQSNRNACYQQIAKQFNFNPDETSEQKQIKEANTMSEEETTTPPAEPNDPPQEEAAVTEPSETEKALKEENAKLKTEIDAQKTAVETLTKSVKELGDKLDKAIKTPVNLPVQEEGVLSGKQANVESEAPTLESSLQAKFASQTTNK